MLYPLSYGGSGDTDGTSRQPAAALRARAYAGPVARRPAGPRRRRHGERPRADPRQPRARGRSRCTMAARRAGGARPSSSPVAPDLDHDGRDDAASGRPGRGGRGSRPSPADRAHPDRHGHRARAGVGPQGRRSRPASTRTSPSRSTPTSWSPPSSDLLPPERAPHRRSRTRWRPPIALRHDPRTARRVRPGRRARGRGRRRPRPRRGRRTRAHRRSRSSAPRSASTATTPPTSPCSWPSRPAGRRATSPRPWPRSWPTAPGVAAVEIAGPGLPQHHPRRGAQGELAALVVAGGAAYGRSADAGRDDGQRRVHLGQPDRAAAPRPHPLGRGRATRWRGCSRPPVPR